MSLAPSRIREPAVSPRRRSAVAFAANLLASAALLLAPFVATVVTATPACAQVRAFVSNERANLRESPTTDSDLKATLTEGRMMRVLQRKGDWVRVELSSGTEGWIRDDMVAVSQSLTKKRAQVLAVRAVAKKAKQKKALALAAKTQKAKKARVLALAAARKRVAAAAAKLATQRKKRPASVAAVTTSQIVRESAPIAVAPTVSSDSDIQHQKLFAARVNVAVASVLRSVRVPVKNKKNVLAITTPVEADPRFASAPVASSITMELEGARTENAAPVLPPTVPGTDGAPFGDSNNPAATDGVTPVGMPTGSVPPVLSRESSRRQRIVRTALSARGARYVFGATGRNGTFDCSGFTQYIYNKNGVGLPRTAREQFSRGARIAKSDLQMGDLVFFKNTYRNGISHVGVYIENGYFIHASSGAHKVTISHLSGSYYQNHWAGARRPAK